MNNVPDPDRLKKLEDAIERIERGLFGEEKLEHWGLVKRVQNHGSRIKRLEVWSSGLIVAGGTIGLIYKIAVAWITH